MINYNILLHLYVIVFYFYYIINMIYNVNIKIDFKKYKQNVILINNLIKLKKYNS